VRFTPEQASEIFKAYPELLSMKQPKPYMTLEDTLQNSLITVLLSSKYDELKKMALDLYQDMTIDDLVDTFERAVALWDKLPEQTMFRDEDPGSEVLNVFSDLLQDTANDIDWKKLSWNEKGLLSETIECVDRWVRVLSGRTPEAKAMARELKEARQLLVFVKDGDIALDDIRPTSSGPKL
jgi:hypothetical protein